MDTIRLTPPNLIFCISERYHSRVQRVQQEYARQLQEAQGERMEAHREAFALLIEDRKETTEALPITDPKEVTRAVEIVRHAMKTGQLGEL